MNGSIGGCREGDDHGEPEHAPDRVPAGPPTAPSVRRFSRGICGVPPLSLTMNPPWEPVVLCERGRWTSRPVR
jgi:hypothetical protein